MKQIFYLLAVSIVILASCSSSSFTKSEKGMEYKIISAASGKTIEAGNFFEIQFTQTYKGENKDTILYDSRKFAYQMAQMDSVQIPPVYFKIFKASKKVTALLLDNWLTV